ncbi:amino acid permease/ SLC12A domain-containing protein [Fusarium flagelliforme]|uniref:Putative carnitine transporter n=1 Tax=Fusarium flagelliforme TaxID=2675880 RepID=A0A395N1N0_9HYPO|nr:amino acid permease/ SLC12A domain-containing protein [Fusarium flagelliforme]KAH7173525.1 amino acid permease/ SLC12A domain-containing protein [Fusarium flagelliforme]RFN53693.1 putative carnitine transporter [Fusarium flagelliforme]
MASDEEKNSAKFMNNNENAGEKYLADNGDLAAGHTTDNADGLHRLLNNRQIQLVAIGGSIGTALFVSIGGGLAKGGPLGLFLAYTIYSGILACVNNGIAEMTTYMPVSGGFIRLAGHWADDALGFMAGWNFFLYEGLLIPFEITAINLVLSYWSPEITNPGPTAGICIGVIILYALLNILAVKAYGEAEFWLSGGKVILILMLFSFTFITMVGGNPQGDAYGFRYWSNPGAFSDVYGTDSLGRFEGFLAALWSAGFTVVGPEYISMVAAEAKRPTVYIKAAFKTVYYRFCFFFIMGSLAVGVIVPYNYEQLVAIFVDGTKGSGTAEASPYVMAMGILKVDVLPHIVNALLLTSIFSAGNTYTYCATRSLYGLALEGRAPRFLRKTTASGVPIWCFCVVMLFPMLSFLQCGSGSAKVLNWLIALMTAGGLINYLVMGITFLNYYRACKAQGIDRRQMPYYGRFQPYCAYIGLIFQFCVVMCYGYKSFQPWNTELFFQNYTMQFVAPCLFIFWKVYKKTRWLRPHEVDLTWERPVIDAYENAITTPPQGFWQEMGQLIGIKKKAYSDE